MRPPGGPGHRPLCPTERPRAGARPRGVPVTVPLRLSLAVAGDTVTCTLGEATLSRRHTSAFDRERARTLSREAVATLWRATHERTFADRNLADLRQVGEELYLALLPAEVREALRGHQGPLLLDLDEVLVTVPW